MAQNTLGRNLTFPIYNADGTAFHDLELKKSTVESVVMSLGDKVTGDVFYKDNTLAVTMQEYIILNGVKYTLVSPPTIVREGMVTDNTQLKGMTKYSFTFYHPMYMLGNFPFTDIAVTQDEAKYLSQNKTFSWIGTFSEFVAKLNANLASTEWLVIMSSTVTQEKQNEIPEEVLSFDKQFISNALKTGYDTWEVPFVITSIKEGETGYAQGKRFLITFGLPTQEIYTIDEQGHKTSTPFIFQFGKGVGLKNNSRTPRNNKIVTRIVGYGSDRNVPYGYPQIPWTGNQSWDYTINNAEGMQPIEVGEQTIMAMSYPIYDGIVGGQRVRLIKHPFTRTTLMPSIYSETVNKKVNPNATGYDPDIEIKDYYDAIDDATHAYPNNINVLAPSVEVHQFEKEYPQLGEAAIISATPYDEDGEYYTYTQWYNYLQTRIATMRGQGIDGWQLQLIVSMRDNTCHYTPATAESLPSASIPAGHWEWRTGQATATLDSVIKGNFVYVTLVSSWYNETHKILQIHADPTSEWDDTMNDDGEYIQSYFKIKLPQLSFDLYACAAVTQEMNINMRSGSCMGCTFPVQVDWELYKENFYDSNGNFAPDGEQRDLEKFPKSNLGSIDVIVKKETDTFGTLMPNQYRYPVSGDKFVFLGISLPTSYITTAEQSLDETMKEYMLENNVHYYDYPLKFDEHFFATNTGILEQIQNNNIVRFQYAGVQMALYIKQITIKYGDKPLPQYDITLTDDVEIVLNQIGQVTDDVSRMRVQVSELQKYYSENLIQAINSKLSKIVDDVCQGRITFQQGLDSLGSVIFHDKIQSPQFEEGLYTGRGWRIDNLGNAEFESARVRSFLEIVELIVNRLQAQEGDTLFTDNDQIEKVDVIEDETDNSISYILTLKEKYQGYITGQMYGNVVKGIINTLAAKQAGVSDVQDSQTVEIDGSNTYYTSWMQVIGTHNTDDSLGVNQIKVVLYGDDYYDDGHEGDPAHLHHFTPAGRNFAPCELMTIARWGCVDYSDPEDSDYESIKASIIRRQRMFMISTTDGRVVKYTGVDSPILKNGNYGVTIGELPEFVKNYPDVRAILNQVGEHTDWLYAQGVVVGKFIKVDIEGNPEPNIIDCGDWVNGANVVSPTPRNGVYLYNEWNIQTQQYETHDVWHNNTKWRCKMTQPVVSGGVAHYYEPTDANSAYWQKLANGGQDGKDGGNTATVFLYKRSESAVTSVGISATLYYKFSTKKLYTDSACTTEATTQLNGWRLTIPSGTDPIYVTAAIAYSNDVKDDITSNEWVTPSQFTENGVDGAHGINTASIFLYKRASNEPNDINSNYKCPQQTLYYKFTDGELYTLNGSTYTKVVDGDAALSGWSRQIPTTNSYPCYVIQAAALGNENYDAIEVTKSGSTYTKKDWSDVSKLVEDGTSPFIADLDNEMDSVACDSSGYTNLGEQYVSTNFYYYKGSAKQTQAFDSITCKIDGYDLGTSYTSNADPSRYFKISSRNLNYGSLTIAVKNGTYISGNVEVKCTVVMTIDGASVSRTLTLTINGVRAGQNGSNGTDGQDGRDGHDGQDGADGQNAILFNLLPSRDAISFARTSSGGLTPSAREVSLVIKKTDGGTSSIISISNSGLSIRYSFSSMPSTSSSGTNWGNSDSTSGTSWYNGTLYVANSVTFTNLYIAAFNSSGVLVDRETIPVVKDGNNGQDGQDGQDGEDGKDAHEVNPNILLRTIFDNGIDFVKEKWWAEWNYVYIDTDTSTIIDGKKCIKINAQGTTLKDLTQNVISSLRNGQWYTLSFNYFSTAAWRSYLYPNQEGVACIDTSAGVYVDGVFVSSIGNNGGVDWNADMNGGRHSITFKTASSFPTEYFYIIFRAMGGNQVSICMPKLEDGKYATAYMANDDDLKGATGQRGKVGRFYYYAGEFDSSNTTQTFVVNDAQAPYFYYDNNYWVFNPETNGTYTMSEMGAPSSSSANWQIMTSDFKYIITEAIFGSYAHFGSFIINGDWMISQYGTINGSQSTSYTKFYPEFINGCSICKSFDVSVSYVNAGSAYFIGGKTYYIKVIGSSFSSGSQLNVRMYNGSFNVGATLRLTSSSSSGTITFEPTTSGTYYLRADMNASGQTAKLTAYVDDCFIPNFAINGLTGETYQQNAHVRGTIRANILYHSITEINLSLGDTQTVSDDCGDIIVAKLQWTSTYSIGYIKLPHASSMNGRLLKLYGAVLKQTTASTAEIRISPQETNLFSYPDGLSRTGFDLLIGDSCELYSDGTKWYLLTISQCRAK